MSAGSMGLIESNAEFGEIEMFPPRGLCDLRLGDGVKGGLPGKEGAQTICSGVKESPLTDKFSLPSMRASNSIRSCSAEIAEDRERLRSRDPDPGDSLRTDKSSGVVSL